MSALLSTHARTSGGCRLREQNALTVMPASVSSDRVVKTVTPDAKRPSTERKESGSSIKVQIENWQLPNCELRHCESRTVETTDCQLLSCAAGYRLATLYVCGNAEATVFSRRSNAAASNCSVNRGFSTSRAGTKSPVTPTSKSERSERLASALAAKLISGGDAIAIAIAFSTAHFPENSRLRQRSYAARAMSAAACDFARTASHAYVASSSAPRIAAYIPSPVNGSKKSAASPTSAAPGVQAFFACQLNGPIARVDVAGSAWTSRAATPGWDAMNCCMIASRSFPISRLCRVGTTTATLVRSSPTGAKPAYPPSKTCMSPTSVSWVTPR